MLRLRPKNSESTAEGGLVAVANAHAIRAFAQVGAVMSDNKIVGTGTLQEVLNEHTKAKRTAAAVALKKSGQGSKI